MIYVLIMLYYCCTVLPRMRWPELLGHPFWREAIREEEYAEEEEESAEEENQNQEEENSCEGLRSLSLRCFCVHVHACVSNLTRLNPLRVTERFQKNLLK